MLCFLEELTSKICKRKLKYRGRIQLQVRRRGPSGTSLQFEELHVCVQQFGIMQFSKLKILHERYVEILDNVEFVRSPNHL